MVIRIITALLRRVPLKFYCTIKNLIKDRHWIDFDALDRSRMYMFMNKLVQDFDGQMKKIEAKNQIMIISEGACDYPCFNAAYLNNMVSLMFYALMEGCIPFLADNKNGDNNAFWWEWYFEQPINTYFKNADYDKCTRRVCKLKDYFGPAFIDAFRMDSVEFLAWHAIYKNLVVLNDKTKQYIERDIASISFDGNTLGTLLRGTDYVALKPQGHPKQPSLDELIYEVKLEVEKKNYSALYIATEEKRIFDAIREAIPEINVIGNQRTYYDTLYSDNNCEYIGEVHFDRENDDYLKGIEYLSSLIILSKCKKFIGSNCGGTLTAMLFSENYQSAKVLNRGFY